MADYVQGKLKSKNCAFCINFYMYNNVTIMEENVNFRMTLSKLKVIVLYVPRTFNYPEYKTNNSFHFTQIILSTSLPWLIVALEAPSTETQIINLALSKVCQTISSSGDTCFSSKSLFIFIYNLISFSPRFS